ncbi:hypothetical protein EJ02DRAFT_439207 [Clathrospora elynae]|uniref:Carrier domain-containing protein n=1 Tax=Clathrospora elynae TaxID=706981 RepID=A0A6A5S7T7_9PLEO|nr:hypothetical protein EJ02DRAFT_439207 [Clathrospora elynae]
MAEAQPLAIAICAWDGELTYHELDELSSRLAGHLVELGIKPEDIVPLCFEKSIWTIVAMLAVLKAGGAFVPLNPEYPQSRRDEILHQTNAKVVMTSAQYSNLSRSSERTVVTTSQASIDQLASGTGKILPIPDPSNAAYVIFTSGSTGVPKGVVVEHKSASTNCLGHGIAFGLTPHTRALQFASYTFDVCITEIITTLMCGGCVCVPSERDKQDDLANFIARTNVNWALLTPTVARMLDPNTVPSLQSLVFGGENVSSDDWNRWEGHVHRTNAYGPTECSVWCNSYADAQGFESGSIGKALASVSWVVDPKNHDKLAPIGSIGELLVEGPILTRGYLNDPEKTAAAFIKDPTWLVQGSNGHPGRQGRLYKTGDLVHYDPDGNLVYVGRKDSQVKLRGQRVELGEVEHYLRKCMPKAQQTAVEVVLPGGDKSNAILAAFLQLSDERRDALGAGRAIDDSLTAQVVSLVDVEEKMGKYLPNHMTPSVYFSISQLPMTVSGKTDRKRLREIGASCSAQQLAEIRASYQGQKRPPSTEAERTMQQLWAQVLNIQPETIGLDDSFFRLGGDSIAAMKLVGEARKAGIQSTVADIFQHPKLVDLTSLSNPLAQTTVEDIAAFSLLGRDTDVVQVKEEIAISCNIDACLVEDIYPCSPLQEGLVSLTSKRAGDYIMQSVLELRADVDESAFKAAWELVVRSTSVLRTRIVQHQKLGVLQAVLAEDIVWAVAERLDEYLEEDKSASMELGEPLSRYALVQEPSSGQRWFVWTLHHALYDGWTLPRILDAVQKAYNNVGLATQPGFNSFIQYLDQQDAEALKTYWQNSLADCEATPFPLLPSTVQQPVADATVEYHCPPLPSTSSDITTSTLVRGAWAIVTASYTNSDDVVFGATVTGRNAPVAGIEAMMGPTIATVPVRVRVAGDQSVSLFFEAIQQQATEMIPFEQTGLHRIAKMGPDARHACRFQTLLLVQPADDTLEEHGTLGRWAEHSGLQVFTTYGLMLQCTLAAHGVQITASFDPRVIEHWQVQKMVGQFSFVMQQLAHAVPGCTVADIDRLTPEDLQELWKWNSKVPPAVNRCVHNIFIEQAKAQPHAPAICAWDGEMTYSELDDRSTQLAGHLISIGVQPEDIVPLCFEKSMWTIVAMLAVLKAGGAFAPLDPEHPQSRHKEILKQTNAKVVLTSVQCSALWVGSAYTFVTVSELSTNLLPATTNKTHPRIHTNNSAYVIFTSGSTGVPKGVVVEHKAVSTSCLCQGRVFGLTPITRFLQFASYTFDVCITEIITTLVHGGCVCVPSEGDRRDDLARVINLMAVNCADLTPTVARLLSPGTVQNLATLALGGEPVTYEDWKRWKDCSTLLNVYGPAECCVTCTAFSDIRHFESGIIGKSLGCLTWVVDPSNHEKLAPLGSTGELLVEGPILARGYLNDQEKTAAAFIDDPIWLVQGSNGHPGRQGRLYKTGDLVHYDPDGNLVCVGRKDSQVKIRGQRIELGEVEHYLRKCMPETQQTAVEVVLPGGDKSNAILAAFLQLSDERRDAVRVGNAADDNSRAHIVSLADVEEKMANCLPNHMTPSVYFAVSQLPMTVSGKTDRKRLREIGASCSAQQLAEIRASYQGQKRPPSTEAERTMQQLWAQVLNIQPETIGLDDSFFRLGGDSIAAMKLVGNARKAGIHFTVADIFQHLSLVDLAGLSNSLAQTTVEDIAAFSLLGPDTDVTRVKEEVAISCNIGACLIEDIYPCSPLQEGLVSLTSKRAGDYIMQSVLELRADVDESAFRAAWELVVRSTSVLRTRIVQHQKLGVLQAVLAEDIVWVVAEGLDEYLKQDKSASMELGEPLARYALVQEPSSGQRWFVWTLHHALYDGWTLPRILDAVQQVYYGEALAKQPDFRGFIKYLCQQDLGATAKYWQDSLADCEASPFPPLPSTVQQPVADATVKYQCPPLPTISSDITTSTLVRAAWAIVTASYTSSDDVVFGATVTGRNAPVAGIEAMMGPTIATVPVRVRVAGDQTVSLFLEAIQQQATEMIPFEQTGLHRIAKMGPDARHACDFQTLLVVQPADDFLEESKTLGKWAGDSGLQVFTTYGLMLQCTLAARGVQITASFDPRVIEHWRVEKTLSQFSFAMQQLACAGPDSTVADINQLTPEDLEELWKWNSEVPPAVERCVHDIFIEQAKAQPHAPAICAWDGEMTYSELDDRSTQLAGHLISTGVQPQDIVPLCFEKSIWTIVAMLAVLKAGGAFAPLDPEHPPSRHEEIFRQTKSRVVLASVQSSTLWEGSAVTVVASGMIGKSIASVSWVVDPNNHNKLAPLDSIGELLVEGPILARGYLNDAEKTAAAFIEDPAWLLQGGGGHHGRHGRLYKTGDLVRYDADGNLIYVGRKDSQVKIRGQRVELGEIEHQVRECMPEAQQTAVEVIFLGGEKSSATLAAFLQLDDKKIDTLRAGKLANNGLPVQMLFLAEVDEQMADRVPNYMLPSVYFALPQLPMNTSGKTDRKRLREIGASFSAQQLADMRASCQGPKRQPSTEAERTMQQLWAKVLNIKPETIGMDDSFFRLGGDSITAMQLSASARSLQIHVSTRDVFLRKTIAEVVRYATSSKPLQLARAADDPVNAPFGLSPIQELYLQLEPTGKISFDQCFFLELRTQVTLESLRAALGMLVQRHSMLRARFGKSEGGRWHQYITGAKDASFDVQYLQPRNPEELVQALQQSRTHLDIESGLVMTAVLCGGNERQSLFMAIHHLVVDLVSWRVLLEELEDFLLGRALSSAPLMTFQTWRAIQAEYTARDTDASTTTVETMEPSQLAYWGATPSAMSNAPTAMEQFVLSSEATSALLGSCNDTFQTRPHELMIAALLYSFAAIFPDRNPPLVFNETHGREPWDDSIDLSRTVGWFTSMFPVQTPASTHRSLLDVIRATKDCMRSFKDNGRQHFASHFANQDSAQAFASLFPVEMIFNYQGVYQQLERGESLFKTLPMPGDDSLASAADGARFSLFTVSAVVQNACFHLALDYSGVTRHETQIREWVQQYKKALEEAPILLRNSTPAWTLSDLPLAFHSYTDLDLFRSLTLAELSVRPEEVEDVYPCSPMQEGILASQNKDPDAYRVCSIIRVVSKHDTRIDCARLQQAWTAVVRRHSLLRALLIDNVPGSSGITNVVLKDPLPSMSVFQAAAGDAVTPQLFRSHYNPADRQTGGLQHHLSICQLDNESVYLCLDINHAIIDAHSTTIIIRDLQTAYSSGLDAHGAQFSSVIAYRQQQSQEEASRYWADHLAGVEPCHFPSIAVAGHKQRRDETIQVPGLNATAIHAFCKTWEITPATVIQTAWALVLSRYTGSTDPCFGTLSSGRDEPIDDIDDILGPLITMLICRVRLDEQLTVLEALRSVQSDVTNALTHQTFSLASVHNMLRLGTSALFNTALTIQRVNVGKLGIVPEISFSVQDGLDPTEAQYDVSIGASYSDAVVEVSLAFRTTCMDQGQATRLAGTLGAAIAAITAEPNSRVQDLNIATEEEAGQLWAWNRDVPPSLDACIHDLFAEKASDQPSAPAICSWDGEMTYHELEDYSTRLASHLVQLGVEPEDIVPLCFEKSMWTIVAMLAVLKAGGAFAPLDPDHPRGRHEEVLKQTQAKVVLTSAQYATRWDESRLPAIAVSQESMQRLPNTADATLPAVLASNTAYIMFTSGSTGIPKGVVLEHRAVSTSCQGHGRVLGFTTRTRTLQFAAYTFDICVSEIITVLLYGGCVCIPSESERRDSLARAINGMNANWAILTASVSRLLSPGTLTSLETLVLGGEQVTSADWNMWKGHVRRINGYGPAECCVVCCAFFDDQIFETGVIGKSIASVSWVVDPNNHNKLAPMGSIGELLVEGPILARGYLDDAEKTAAAFIKDPAWLLQGSGGHPGRHGRLYKTGDLVRYDADGNLIYVGRIDSQVKIRGQRVELGEIEHHVRECMPEAQQTAVEVIFPGGEKSSATLAAFLQLEDKKIDALRAGKPADNGLPVQMLFLAEVDKQMVDRVPNYMLPSVYFALPQLPMTTSGKTDRKRLREIGASFSAQQLAEMRASCQGPKRQPSTEAERTMQQLWAKVLNIKPETIGMDDSFFRLGGDSITAMQLSASARSLQILVSTRDVFLRKTIAEVVRYATSSKPLQLARTAEDPVNVPFGLSPIQELYLQLEPTGKISFDQCFLLEIRTQVTLESLCAALTMLAQRHSMLRARFGKSEGGRWHQYVTDATDASFVVQHLQPRDTEELVQALQQSRSRLDIESGLVMTAVLCDGNERQSLFMAIHHLVVDLVSWRVLLEELEDFLLGRALSPAPSMTFQTWRAIQAEYTARDTDASTTTVETMEPSQLAYWGATPSAMSHTPIAMEQFVLSSEATSALLGSCNDTFQTRPHELIIAALLYSFAAVFPDRNPPPVFNETHGREPWDDSIDLSRTVGWFTSMFPVQTPASTHRSLLDVIRATKDCMRSFKDNGRQHFASHFANQDSAQAFASLFPVEMVFNYQGVYQQLERSESLFKTLSMPGDDDLASAAEGARFSLFTVSAVVQNACAHLAVNYSGVTRHETRIREWVQQYKTALEEAPILLRNSTPAWTLSDLPLAFHSYTDLDLFRSHTLAELSVRPEEVEDVYPCSPMQEGILASQNKDPDAYRVCSIIRVVSKHDTRIDCARLQQAWTAVVRRHSLLRALLIDNVPGSSGITNVVLKDPLPSMSVFQAAAGDAVTPQLFRSRYNPADQQTGGLQHHLSICQLDNESVYLCLDINHAIIDAHSTTIIIRDLQTAYTSGLDAHGAQFRSVVAYRQQQSQEEASRYWADHLAGIEPCHFPSMAVAEHRQCRDETTQVPGLNAAAIHAFCKTWEITPATVIQTAWALVLSRYTGSSKPCFGTLSSGRDAPIDDIEDIFGPLITMLTCWVHLDEQLTVLEALRSVQSDFTNALTHQTFSLANVHNMLQLGTSALFNTALTIQRVNVANPGFVPKISFPVQDGLDPTEYDVSIGASYSDAVVEVGLAFRTTCMDQGQATRLAGTLGAAIAAITAEPDSRVQDLNIATEEEVAQLWAWNHDVPPSMDACIHDLFAEKARDQPSAPAICSWDGEMTYQELDDYSTKLAGHLVQLGVEPEDIVPLCFEKSMWTIVAMLAVLKAGGAFAPLDPDHPRSRHEEIFKQTQSKVVLTSAQYASLWDESRLPAIAVSQASMRRLPNTADAILPAGLASNTAYIMFTSGSTGIPKGVVLEHRAVSSSCQGHGKVLGFTTRTRTLQFAAYTFDICIEEIFTTLLNGGCVCVPTEDDRRSNPANAMNEMDVNLADLTPTVARLLIPGTIPSLTTLVLGGEFITEEDCDRWPRAMTIINAYGPTECSINCTAYRGLQCPGGGMIGKSIASVSWVVDPNNHNKLAPLGSIGELLVEGPILARGYLDDAEKTAAAFIEDPAWLLQGGGGYPGRHGRLYKTGDLVRYDANGNLIYIGRNDSQVKIRGQRVELGEIEHHVRECMPEAQQTAVEVIFAGGEKSSATLAAFLQLDNKKIDALRAGKPADNGLLVQMLFIVEVDEQMVDRVPNYMLPSVYFALPQLPMSTSGKTDRKRLREIGASFSAQQLAAMRTSSEGLKRAPSTQAERTMQQLWARVLNIEPGSIGRDDSFFRLGGDSIAAMKLVGEARKQGLQLDSAHVFRQPKLAQMCVTPRRPIVNSTEPLPPFSLLPPTIKDRMFCRGNLLGAVQRKDVANILPTTHTQRMFIDRGIKFPHEAFNYLLFDIGPDLDVQLLRDSCQRLLDYFPILRTQFTPFQGDLWQVVLLRPHLPFITFNVSGPLSEETHAICLQDTQKTDPLGLPTAFMLVRNKSIRHQLILRLSHAQYDGVCLPIIFDTLSALYKQETLPPAPPDFSAFLAHTRHQRTESARYWCELLKGSHITQVTAHLRPKTSEAPALENVMVERMICAPQLPKNITMASFLSSAWALVLSSITREDDVVYGHLVAGRNADIPGVAEIVGPCLNIVPVRVRMHLAKAPAELVRSVHEQYISLGQSDSAQLNEIIQDCTDWPAGSEFDSIVQHQNINEHPAIDFAGNMAKFQWFKNPFRVAEQLYLLTEPQGDQLKLTLDGNTRILTVETTHSVLDMFAATIAKLSTSLQEPFTPQNFSSHSASGTERAQG